MIVCNQPVRLRGLAGPSTPRISSGADNSALKLPRLVRMRFLVLRISTIADLVLVLPTLPTTAISLMDGLVRNRRRTEAWSERKTKYLNNFISTL